MTNINITTISAQQIRIFIAAGETENFTLAAQQLYVTEPLVSRTITDLENKLGFPLFKRGKRKVQLTESGEALLADWQRLYSFMSSSVENAYRIYLKQKDTISISVGSAFDDEIYVSLLDTIKNSLDNPALNITRYSSDFVIKAVELGTVDIGLITSGDAARVSSPDIRRKQLFSDCSYIDIPTSLSFAVRDSINVSELSTIPIILLNPVYDRGYNADIMSLYASNGITPTIHSYVNNFDSLLASRGFVEAGVILNRIISPSPSTNVKRIPINGINTGITAIWRMNNEKDILSVVDIASHFFSSFTT